MSSSPRFCRNGFVSLSTVAVAARQQQRAYAASDAAGRSVCAYIPSAMASAKPAGDDRDPGSFVPKSYVFRDYLPSRYSEGKGSFEVRRSTMPLGLITADVFPRF